MVIRRRGEEVVRLDRKPEQTPDIQIFPAVRRYRLRPEGRLRTVQKPDIQPVLHPLEIADRTLDQLRLDFRERLNACTSPEARLQMTSAFLSLVENLREKLFSATESVPHSASSDVLPHEVTTWGPSDVLELIDTYRVTNQNIGLLLQWIMVHTAFKSYTDIEAASGVADSVISRFRTGWYQKSPYQIPNGDKLLRWIRTVAERRIPKS